MNTDLILSSYMPVKIVSGSGCLKNSSNMFSVFGKRCIVVTGASSAKLSGALDDCIACLNKQKIEYTVFDRIEQNPYTKTCYEAGLIAREFNAEFVIGIGGGSPLDASKAIAIFACNASMAHSEIYNRKVPSEHLPVILIGTTAGTGSEVTGVSVLTNSDTGAKKSISGADCYADIAFSDYNYTLSLPQSVTCSTALDAFCHAAESFLSSTSNSLSQLYSLKAVSLLNNYILNTNKPVNVSEREKLCAASVFAGLAINITGTCFPHTVGYYLTEKYNVPHGFACAAFLPVFFERAKKYCPDSVRAIENAFGADADSICKIIKSVCKLNVNISEQEAAAVCERWKNGVKNFDRTPGGFSCEDAYSALILL